MGRKPKIKIEPIPDTTIAMPSSAALRSAGRRLRKCIEVLERTTSLKEDRNWPVNHLLEVVQWVEAVQKIKRLKEIKEKNHDG